MYLRPPNINAIAAVEGVGVLFIGPADMSIALGATPLGTPSAELTAAIDRVLAVGCKAGVAVGKGGNTPEEIRALQAKGFTWIAHGPDYFLLKGAINARLVAFSRTPAGQC